MHNTTNGRSKVYQRFYAGARTLVPDVVKGPVKRQLLRFQIFLRAHNGCYPDFIILGTQKGGTTSLYRYLTQHPDIHSATRKEIGYFNNRDKHDLAWYRSHFPTRFFRTFLHHVKGRLFQTGEADPAYILDPYALSAIHHLVPQVKLVLLLRDPVERAWSHYRHSLRLGVEPLHFTAALDAEENRIEAQWSRMMRGQAYYGLQIYHYAYKHTGHYDEQLDALFNVFDKRQVLIMKSEDLFAAPVKTVASVVRFLGLSPFTLGDVKTYNKGNRHPLSPDLQSQLATYFEPHNRRLEKINTDLTW
jgi:hypothetical protein